MPRLRADANDKMTRRGSPRIPAFAGLASAGFLAALILGRPEPAIAVAPFAVLLVLGLSRMRAPDLQLGFDLPTDRVLEGDVVEAALDITSSLPVERLDLLIHWPPGLQPADGKRVIACRVRASLTIRIPVGVRCLRWGGYALGRVLVRARDPLGFVIFETQVDHRQRLAVYPRPEVLSAIIRAAETQVFSGNETARVRGDGIEFADARPFVPGDRIRRINWRLSTRHRELYVNDRHPERSSDVVLFLDTFADLARDHDASTLRSTVRAAAALARRYLARRDRVGLISYGGILRWLMPSMGSGQATRIVDALLETEAVFSYAWKDIQAIPGGTLPPKALVIALTPLLDERAIDALLDLRGRGFDLAVVEIAPESFMRIPHDPATRLGMALWTMERDAIRDRFRQLSVAVSTWREGETFQGSTEEVQAFRRFARRVRV